MGLEDLSSFLASKRSSRVVRWLTTILPLFLLICAGCATVAPIEEVRLFSKAFSTFEGASQPLLDDLAAAERRQGKDNAVTKAKRNQYAGHCEGIIWAEPGFIEGFCVDDAAYFSEIGDPPATRALREGIGIIGDYSDVLLTLAEGRNLDEASSQVQALGENVAGLLGLVPGIGWAGPALTGALGALQPVIRDAAQAKNVEELKRLVLEGAPHVKDLIESLRNAAPELFNTVVYQAVKGATSPEALGNEAAAKAYIERISAYRMAVSNYVVLLNELEGAFEQLVEAIQRPRNAVSLASVAQRSAELQAHAEAWRRVYSILRIGGE